MSLLDVFAPSQRRENVGFYQGFFFELKNEERSHLLSFARLLRVSKSGGFDGVLSGL